MRTLQRPTMRNKTLPSPTKRPLVIIGAGGHAVSVANVAQSAGFHVHNFVDASTRGNNLCGRHIIGEIAELGDARGFYFGIAIGDNATRERIHAELCAAHSDIVFPPLVHASAVICDFAELGEGTVVMPNAVIGPKAKIGRFCILNTLSSIDHDSLMADYSSMAPGAIAGGTVSIGVRSAISIGAVVKHGVTIGGDCVVGANSYLETDLPANQVAYGTPAKLVRRRNATDPYLK